MPQDSLTIWQPADSAQIPDSIHALIQREIFENTNPPYDNTYDSYALAVVIGSMFLVFVTPLIWRWGHKKYKRYVFNKILSEKGNQYHMILEGGFPYYRKLSRLKQDVFLERTIKFILSKRFEYVEIKADERMPVLISAAAVQLTFGLQNYLLDHFKTIYVMERSYHYGLSGQAFEGHVNYNGIYLAWDSFSKQFENYMDGSNVGLHEMAHALAYVNFSVDEGLDPAFKHRFYTFSHIARPVFNEIQKSGNIFLGSYAATNYNEFWAVCIENFFERPETFKDQLPELYNGLCRLLNQDPLSKDFILMTVQGE